MATRYGRRTLDDKVEYYDSLAEMKAAEAKENRETRAVVFGFAGLLMGGYLAYWGIQEFGLGDWPKTARFAAVVASGIVGAAVGVRLAEFVWWAIVGIVGIGIVYIMGALVWRLV